jgi:hypothetical protein
MTNLQRATETDRKKEIFKKEKYHVVSINKYQINENNPAKAVVNPAL